MIGLSKVVCEKRIFLFCFVVRIEFHFPGKSLNVTAEFVDCYRKKKRIFNLTLDKSIWKIRKNIPFLLYFFAFIEIILIHSKEVFLKRTKHEFGDNIFKKKVITW